MAKLAELESAIKPCLFDSKTSFRDRVAFANETLVSYGIPNSQELGTRLVKIVQTPWFLQEPASPIWIESRAQEAVRRLAGFGDPSEVGIEVITDWAVAQEKSQTARQFEHEASFAHKNALALRATRQPIYADGDNGQRRKFLSRGMFEAWQFVIDQTQSDPGLQSALEVTNHLALMALGSEGGIRGGQRVWDNFHTAYYDPAWGEEHNHGMDDMYNYVGRHLGLKTYEKLVQAAPFGIIDGRVFNQPVDTALLYAGLGLVGPKLEERGLSDPTEPLMELYDRGLWPIGYTQNVKEMPGFTVLVPPKSVELQLTQIELIANNIPEIQSSNIVSALTKEGSERTVTVNLNPALTSDEQISIVLQQLRNSVTEQVDTSILGPLTINVNRSKEESIQSVIVSNIPHPAGI